MPISSGGLRIKSIQRGIANFGGGSSVSVTLTAVNVNKSMVITDAIGTTAVTCLLSNSTTLYLSAAGVSYSNMSWQVVEFE